MNNYTLQNFIHQASKATYASGDQSLKQKEQDDSTTIAYTSGEYSFHDNYFGGEPYGGREVVFYNKKPVWMMVYYGRVYEGIEHESVYTFLIDSLSRATADMPYRGPAVYESGEWHYENTFSGNVEQFSGTEKIYKSSACVYEASYIGGLVDKEN